jgi:hypothetical protein
MMRGLEREVVGREILLLGKLDGAQLLDVELLGRLGSFLNPTSGTALDLGELAWRYRTIE